MLTCEVIADLMVVYSSGEASPETRRLVEEHLAQCPACRKAYETGQLVADTLDDMRSADKPANGSRFLIRTRRLFFAIGASTLLLLAFLMAFFQRIIMGHFAAIPLPSLPGARQMWFVILIAALLVYMILLFWRKRIKAKNNFFEILLLLIIAIPLFITTVVAFDFIDAGTIPLVFMAFLALLAIYLVTYINLPKLPYMTVAALVVLFFVHGLLIARALAGIVAVGDFTWQTPVTLGHPAKGVTSADSVRVDLSILGLEWVGDTTVTQVNGIEIQTPVEAIRTTYRSHDRQVYLTVIEFESYQGADEFFATWIGEVTKGVQLAEMEINLPKILHQGRLLRTYNLSMKQTFNAWQTEKWVTIIEVPGPLSQASPLARAIKETVSSNYKKM